MAAPKSGMASMPSLSWQKARKCLIELQLPYSATRPSSDADRVEERVQLRFSHARLLLLSTDGASDTVKSDFLRAHYKKEKEIRVAQWRENERMGGAGNRALETMRATRFSDLNRSMRFQGRKLSPRKSRRSRSPGPRPHSSVDMYSTEAASHRLDRTQPKEVWPVRSVPSVETVVGGGRQPRGEYGRDSVTGTHTTSQPNLYYSPPNDAPEEPFIPVLLAPRRSSKRVSDISRRQYELPPNGAGCVESHAHNLSLSCTSRVSLPD